MLKITPKNIIFSLNNWYCLVLICIILQLFACTSNQKSDVFLTEINRVVNSKSIPKSVPKQKHKKWITSCIDSLAKRHTKLNSKQIEQYKHFYNVKIDFLYEYYADHELEVISDKIAYIFKNYKPAYCSPDLQAHFYNELAHFYASIGLFKEAILYHKKMKQTGADLSFLLHQYKHLGNYYYQHRQYNHAIKSYKEKYKKQCKKADIQNDMLAHMCNNIGLAYAKNNALDSALFYFDKAKTYWNNFPYALKEKNYLKGIADGNKAEAYMRVGAYKKAIPLLLHEIKVTQAYSKALPQYLTSTRLSLAECYLNENQYKKAEEQLLILQKLVEQQSYNRQKKYYELAKKLALKQQNIKTLLNIGVKLDTLNSLIYLEKNKLNEIEKALRLQTNNIQAQIAKRDKSAQQLRRNYFIGLFALIILMLTLGIFYRKRVIALRKQNKMMREEIQRRLFNYQYTENELVFTKREEEIIPFIISKKTNKEISECLFISLNTVKYHVKNIYDKLEVTNREQAIYKFRKSNG